MSEQTKAAIFCFVAFLLGLACSGCASRAEANRVSYQLQTKCPDIWDAEPRQEVSIKMEFKR